MDFTNLIRGDRPRAASPVIGVVLAAAVTVVVAAVIGSFVFGPGGTAQEASPPDAEFRFTFESTGGDYTVTATHAGGEAIPDEETVTLSGPTNSVTFDGEVTPGDSESLTSVPPDSGVRVVWTSADGEHSQVIAEASTPS